MATKKPSSKPSSGHAKTLVKKGSSLLKKALFGGSKKKLKPNVESKPDRVKPKAKANEKKTALPVAKGKAVKAKAGSVALVNPVAHAASVHVASVNEAKLRKPATKKRAKRGAGFDTGFEVAAQYRADFGEAVCREVACEGLATSGGYCRLHYIKNWKKIKRKELILKEGKLNQYIDELVGKYPDKYIEAIRQDLASDKDFAKVIYDLDLDEGVDDFDGEGESIDAVIDTIKRDFEDEGEGF